MSGETQSLDNAALEPSGTMSDVGGADGVANEVDQSCGAEDVEAQKEVYSPQFYQRRFESHARSHNIDLSNLPEAEVAELHAKFIKYVEKMTIWADQLKLPIDIFLTMCEGGSSHETLDQTPDLCVLRTERYARFFEESQTKKIMNFDLLDGDEKWDIWFDYVASMESNIMRLMQEHGMSEDAVWVRACPTAEQQQAMAKDNFTTTIKIRTLAQQRNLERRERREQEKKERRKARKNGGKS